MKFFSDIRTIATLLTFIGVVYISLPITSQTPPPNIILIIADDQGWTGTSVILDEDRPDIVSDYYQTTHTVGLARRGMRFSRAYAPAALCSPTRASILTGRSVEATDFTLNMGNSPKSGRKLIDDYRVENLALTDTTVAEVLQDFGYKTGLIHKWHVGSGGARERGFEIWKKEGEDDHDVLIHPDPKGMFTDARSAMDFMRGSTIEGRPFYLQVCFFGVHLDKECTQESYDKYLAKEPGVHHNDPYYAGMTEDLDESVRRILQEVKRLGIEDNTYIIYTSDNGGEQKFTGELVSSNYPLRDGKKRPYEGGIRVPLIIAGPGIPENTYSKTPVIGYDLYPTIIDLATGSTEMVPQGVEGSSIKNVLIPNGVDRFARKDNDYTFYFHLPNYIRDEWSGDFDQWTVAMDYPFKVVHFIESGERYLFDLEKDLSETTPLNNKQLELELLRRKRAHLLKVNGRLPRLDPTWPNHNGPEGDLDNDGLSDAWEAERLLTHAYSGEDDTDGDGTSNLDEYLNVTDPLLVSSWLPSNYALFTGKSQNNDIIIEWATHFEIHTSEFIVERSIDDINFSPLESVNAGMNSSQRRDYKITDYGAAHGKNYYRIKMVDVDGSFKYSPTITVDFVAPDYIRVFPNPAEDFALVSLKLDPGQVLEVRLVDASGKVLRTESMDKPEFMLDTHALPEGIYYINIIFDKDRQESFPLQVIHNE